MLFVVLVVLLLLLMLSSFPVLVTSAVASPTSMLLLPLRLGLQLTPMYRPVLYPFLGPEPQLFYESGPDFFQRLPRLRWS